MKVTENSTVFWNAAKNTPFDRVCVKRRAKSLQELFDMRYSHGILVSPTIPKAICQGRDQEQASALLAAAVKKLNQSIVIVRGHGWGIDGDKFVWTGTTQEFNKVWEID